MKTKKDYIDYINKFQEGNEFGLEFIEKQTDFTYKDGKEIKTLSQDNIEHILDFLYSTKKHYKTIGLKTILEKSIKWSAELQKKAIKKDNEVGGVDYSIEYDFKDGMKFVKLISQNAYNREGKLMSHCVASYFGRNVNIYSLRDEKNLPHCTIEENNQVKGKGNQVVDNKYFGYCIKFLEYKGFSIGENEMKNIGFYKLETIDENLSVDEKYLYDGKYISDKNLDKIKDKDGEQYYGFGFLKIKKLVELDLSFNLKWNFDISLFIDYFNRKVSEKTAVANESSSTAVTNENYSTAVANGHSSTAVANESSSTAVTNENYSTAVANGHSSTAVANEHSSTAVANESSSTAVTNENYSTAVANGHSSTAVANEHSSTAVANKRYSTAVANGHSSTAVANGYSSTAVANGYFSTAVANEHSSTAVANGYSSTAVANGYSSTAVANKRYSTAVANKRYSTAVANGYSSTAVANGYSSTAVANGETNCIAFIRGQNSKAKGKIGAWLILTEYDKKEEFIIDIQSKKIDGIILKEDTFYKLENGKFIEINS